MAREDGDSDTWRDRELPNEHTALEYFARSPFYDPSGGVARVFTLRPPRPEEAAVGLFVVEERLRTPGVGDVVLSAFAILQGTVLRAPALRSLVHARTASAAAHVSRAVAALRVLEDAEAPTLGRSLVPVAQQLPWLPADRVDALVAGLLPPSA